MWPNLISSLIIDLIVAFLVTALLLAVPGLSFFGKVWFVVIAGIAGGLGVMLQHWNWWGFTTGYTVVGILDAAIGWFLAGLAMAKWVVAKG